MEREAKISQQDKELEQEASLTLESVRLYLESIPKFSFAPLFKGAVAFQALTGARANEFLPNLKYQTYMDIRGLHLNPDANGDRWIVLPLIEKRRALKPLKRRVFLLPHNTKFKEEVYLYSVLFEYLRWRETKEYKRYIERRALFGAKSKIYAKFLDIPREVLLNDNEYKSLTLREQKHILSLRRWSWLWRDRKKELDFVMFPLLYRFYLRFVKSYKIPALDIEGNVVFLKAHTHLFRKWRVSSLLAYGLTPIEIKAFIGWNDIKSINPYIKMEHEYLMSGLKKLKG